MRFFLYGIKGYGLYEWLAAFNNANKFIMYINVKIYGQLNGHLSGQNILVML